MLLRSVTTVLLALFLSPACLMAAQSSKEIVFRMKGGTSVTFSHGIHLKKDTNCKSCHSAIFDLSKHRSFTMADMEKGRSCGACHNGVKAFSVAKVKDCVRCHRSSPGAISFKVKGTTDTFFSHDSHAARNGGKCKDCHNARVFSGKRGVSMSQMEKGSSCGACHNGKTAFTVAANCSNCHKGFNPREITFKSGSEISAAKFSHKFHLDMYKCQDCHTKIYPFGRGKAATMDDMEKKASCGACHNGKDAFTVSGDCDKCHRK